jgi:hypothetical protein
MNHQQNAMFRQGQINASSSLFFFLNAPGQRYYSHDKSWKLDAFNACMTFFLYNSLDEEHSVLSDAESIQ